MAEEGCAEHKGMGKGGNQSLRCHSLGLPRCVPSRGLEVLAIWSREGPPLSALLPNTCKVNPLTGAAQL